MKIGILYICLGEYSKFWGEFYKSSEKFLVPNIEKNYYIFSDIEKKEFKKKNVYLFKEKDLGWPGNTLMRFHFFDKIKDILIENDYIYFFNSNFKFINKISSEEIIPNKDNDFLVNLYWHKINVRNFKHLFFYERNKKSEAYIPFDQGKIYYQGGMNGGRTKEYLNLVNNCMKMINKDLDKRIKAKSNDESYLNKYLLDKNPKLLNKNYGMPEEWVKGNEKLIKAILVEKNKVLGYKNVNLKKQELLKLEKLKLRIKFLIFYGFYILRKIKLKIK